MPASASRPRRTPPRWRSWPTASSSARGPCRSRSRGRKRCTSTLRACARRSTLPFRRSLCSMDATVRVACIQAEPAVLDREATLGKLERLAAEAAGDGADLLVFPEAFVPAYPSSVWARAFAGWAAPGAKEAFALLARQSVAVPGPAEARIAAAAREHGVWIVTGVTEIDPERPSTLYNTLLYHSPDGTLVERHRKLVPTNHERLVWGQGNGGGLRAMPTPLGRPGGRVCWENYMPLARFALYEAGVEIYVASTADDGIAWQATLVHL